jgi:hypothetical protein
MASPDYPTSTDDQGNENNIVQGNDRLALEMKLLSTMPVIPEETSPDVRNFELPKVIITDETGREEVFKEYELPKPGQVPRIILTNVDGHESLFPIVPNIFITDSDGNTHEMDDLYQVPKAPAVNSFSDSSVHSEHSISELECPEGDKESIKASRKYKDLSKVPFMESNSEETLHAPEGDKEPIKSSRKFRDDSKKPFEGLKKRASRLLSAVSLKILHDRLRKRLVNFR